MLSCELICIHSLNDLFLRIMFVDYIMLCGCTRYVCRIRFCDSPARREKSVAHSARNSPAICFFLWPTNCAVRVVHLLGNGDVCHVCASGACVCDDKVAKYHHQDNKIALHMLR